MILYEFVCSDCGLKFEEFATVTTRDEVKECPECGGAGKHHITPTNFHLSGHPRDGFPGAVSRWERQHEAAGRRGRKQEEEQARETASSMY